MTKKPRILFFALLLALSVLLSACSGQVAESWPGITVVPEGEPNGGTAFVAYTGQIYQVNLENGAEISRYPAEPDGKINFYAPPAVATDGNLLVGGYNFVFYKVQPGNGDPIWSFDDARDRYIAKPLAMGDLVYAPSADNRLYALRQQDGSLAWTFTAGHSLWSETVTDGELLFQASMDHFVYGLDPATGDQVWKSEDLGGPVVATPALSSEGVLYTAIFGSKTDDPARTSQFVALDTANGKTLWKLPLTGWVWASPLLYEDALYFGDTAGYFYAVNASDGKLLWKYPQSGAPSAKTSILGAAAVVDDKVYFGSEAGVITILNRADGTTPQEITIGGQIYSGLVAAGDVILFAPIQYDEAILAALNPDGTIRWKFLPAKE